LTLGGSELWHADYDGGRMTKITRANGLETAFAYTADGLPTEVMTGIPDAGGTITDPLHRLGFTWTTERLRRTKRRQDIEDLLSAFHYDEVGHLESLTNEPTRPAVRRNRPDLAIEGLPTPTEMTEDWRVNRVDELTLRDRTEHGAFGPVAFDHNELHQVENRTAVDPAGYTWGVNGNISTRTGGPYGDAIFTHDWRDRLASVEQGSTTTDILVDPLGRMVGKVKHTADGDVARAYLHDGDQVAVEYVQPAGSTNWQPERRHIWSTWIDQLAVEQIDTDGDGTLETTLYPITDMLGSVQLLTDDTGSIVERIEYDPDGTPHFWSADTTGPAVTRIVWTGDGVTPAGAMTPQVFEIGFSEVVDAASVSGASATLTPEGGSAVDLTLTLAADGRSAVLSGAAITAGVNYALHVEGLRDPSGNVLQPEDRMLVVADDQVFEVLMDTVPPLLVAVMDAVDGVYLLFDEAVVGNGGDLAAAVTINRQGVEVAGETTRVEANVLKWTPAEPTTWLLAAQYSLSGINVEDLGGNAVDAASMSFTHLAVDDGQMLIARQAATESVPMGASAYGLTTLFQGRTWHSDLGMYYYRARWYLPEGGVFGERDPVGYGDSAGLYDVMNGDPANRFDPFGLLSARIAPGQDPYTCDKLRVEVNGRIYLVSPYSGIVKDGETGRKLDPGDPRARAARRASGWDFENSGLNDLISGLERGTRLFQNRWTAGLTLEVAAAAPNGFHGGVNIQFWLGGDNLPVGALYVFDTISPYFDDEEKDSFLKDETFTMAGLTAGGGVAADVAFFLHPKFKMKDFNDMSDQELVDSWRGSFHDFAMSIPAIGVGFFSSYTYEGFSLSFKGIGAGVFASHTNFHLFVGPFRSSSDMFSETLFRLKSSGIKISRRMRDSIYSFAQYLKGK
jgi:RHS repeat-associated protein